MRFSSLACAILLGCTLAAYGQQSAPPTLYKVQLDLQPEPGSKDQPTRHFTLFVSPSRTAWFKAIDTLPIEATDRADTISVGDSIECTVQESGDKLQLRGVLEHSKITGTVNLGTISQPVVAQKKLSFDTAIDPGKLTQIATLLSVTITKAD